MVVLPAPFGPTKPVIEPLSICKSTPSTALIPPKCFDKFFTVIINSKTLSCLFLLEGYMVSKKCQIILEKQKYWEALRQNLVEWLYDNT